MSATASCSVASRVLVVDDNPSVSSLLCRVLEAEGYEVEVAEDGRSALARIGMRHPDLILLDLNLPHLNGDEICRRIKQNPATRLIPIIIVTGDGAFQNRLDAWENGADDCLSKPFHLAEITTRCRSLLRIKRLVDERDSAEAVLFTLARTVEAKSLYTHGHSERVTRYALALARTVGLPDSQLELLRKGSLLHDIGKISVPDAILNKPGSLTKEEYDVIKLHPVQGAHIIKPLLTLRHALPLILWHHERLDGKGYPDGLGRDEIPHMVRVLSVADVFDSLSSERPYRTAMPLKSCFQVLRQEAAAGGLDRELVETFCAIVIPTAEGITLAGERDVEVGLSDPIDGDMSFAAAETVSDPV